MRRYESVVILEPEMADDDIRNFTEKYSTLIKTSGGEIIKIEDWGFKRFAYRVKKRDRGRYLLFDFVGLPALMAELERQFKISEDVMKFLSVKVDDEVDLEAFQAAAQTKEVLSEAQTPVNEQSVTSELTVPTLDDAGPQNESAVATPGNENHAGSDVASERQFEGRKDLAAAEAADSTPSSVPETEEEGL
ncbi:MAG: 30S ribosomal protein S6 [Desulfomonile sp.]|nr:30S ribosomal protein S6 [Deltaproteobacteria bacterium]